VPQAVGDEAGGADQVHPLEGGRAAGQLLGCYEQVSEQDQARARPAGNLDEDLGRVQVSSR
jgi:hypothetical protein